MTDSDLIHRAQAGDSKAFDALIEQHREAMFRCAFLMLRDADAAEDVAQEAVYRIYHNLSRFDVTLPFRPWALHITRNLSRNYYRSWKRLRHTMTRFWTHQALTPTHDAIEEVVAERRQASQLHDAVSSLKPDHREVIYLRFFLGLSVEEAALTLHVSAGTVKSRTHRALADLKTRLQTDYPVLWEEVSHDK